MHIIQQMFSTVAKSPLPFCLSMGPFKTPSPNWRHHFLYNTLTLLITLVDGNFSNLTGKSRRLAGKVGGGENCCLIKKKVLENEGDNYFLKSVIR